MDRQSAVLIVPAALREAGNAFGEAQGWGPGNFSVPLSADGGATVTHFGCRADVGPNFDELFTNPPPGGEALAPAMIYDFSSALWDDAHFAAVIAARGLVRL